MTHDEMQTEVDRICGLMRERDLIAPECKLQIESNARPQVMLCWSKSPHGSVDYAYKWCTADTPAEAIRQAEKAVRDMPNAAETRRKRATEAVAKAIEAAREAGLDDELIVNPLMAVAKELSENALEGPK